mgnify:FL=1
MSKKDEVAQKIAKKQKEGKEKAKNAVEEYKKFAIKGNAMDLAVGVVIGSAFTNIVNSIVNTAITPLIGLLTNRVDLSTLFISLSGETYATLAEAKQAGALTFNYGELLNAILNFFIVSLVLFVIIRIINHSKIKEEKEKAKIKTTKECPYCLSTVPIKATKCAFCTSDLNNVNETKSKENAEDSAKSNEKSNEKKKTQKKSKNK